jgi:hypothetical protein
LIQTGRNNISSSSSLSTAASLNLKSKSPSSPMKSPNAASFVPAAAVSALNKFDKFTDQQVVSYF